MAKWCSTLAMNAFLNYLSTQGKRYLLCSSHPGVSTVIKYTSYSTAKMISGCKGAASSMTTFSNAQTLADAPGAGGASSGIQMTWASKTTQPVKRAGWITHVCVASRTSFPLYVTTCTSRQVTTGDKVTIPAWTVVIKKPT